MKKKKNNSNYLITKPKFRIMNSYKKLTAIKKYSNKSTFNTKKFTKIPKNSHIKNQLLPKKI